MKTILLGLAFGAVSTGVMAVLALPDGKVPTVRTAIAVEFTPTVHLVPFDERYQQAMASIKEAAR